MLVKVSRMTTLEEVLILKVILMDKRTMTRKIVRILNVKVRLRV